MQLMCDETIDRCMMTITSCSLSVKGINLNFEVFITNCADKKYVIGEFDMGLNNNSFSKNYLMSFCYLLNMNENKT